MNKIYYSIWGTSDYGAQLLSGTQLEYYGWTDLGERNRMVTTSYIFMYFIYLFFFSYWLLVMRGGERILCPLLFAVFIVYCLLKMTEKHPKKKKKKTIIKIKIYYSLLSYEPLHLRITGQKHKTPTWIWFTILQLQFRRTTTVVKTWLTMRSFDSLLQSEWSHSLLGVLVPWSTT